MFKASDSSNDIQGYKETLITARQRFVHLQL